ncbi:MAG: hypothetical protein ACLQIQ_21550 [Beijerinckiaceae bacterium]
MASVTLSRWTMSYFAVALVGLVAAQCLMAAGYGFPAAPIDAPETLVLVHVVAIGWLSLLMCGALFQFVPVLVARPLYNDSLPLPALVCLVIGLAALLLGFLQQAGQAPPNVPFLPAGGILLGAGFTLALWNLGRTLWDGRPLAVPARFVLVGLFSVGATVTFGIIFALVLGGVTTYPHFLDVTAAAVPIHVIAGLGGWLTFTAIGVSYRLLAMFMLAPELDGASTHGAFYLGAAALAVAIVGGVAAICVGTSLSMVLGATGLLGLGALVLYGRDIVHLYQARRRRAIELNSRMAGYALANLATAAILTIVLLGLGALDRHVGALVFLVSFGWLSGLGLAQLYKIVAFLTWLECYGPVLGKVATPRVQDLVVEPRATKWFLLYFVAVWGGTAALLADSSAMFRGAAALMMIATCGIIVQLVRARSLSDVTTTLRFPDGVKRPRLLLALAR